MPVHLVSHLSDPLLAPFRILSASGRNPEDPDLLLCEGGPVVERLLESDFETVALLVTARKRASLEALAPPSVPLLVLDDDLLKGLAGPGYKSGIYALARRRSRERVTEWMGANARSPMTLLVLPNVNNPRNVGTILRVCAGFGVDGVLVGPACVDPFHRYAVRASMGAVFHQPLMFSADLEADLAALRHDWAVRLAAATLTAGAIPLHGVKRPAPPQDRVAIVLGNEFSGLDRRIEQMCDDRVTLPMAGLTDSLNVATAAAVFLYEYTRPIGEEAPRPVGRRV